MYIILFVRPVANMSWIGRPDLMLISPNLRTFDERRPTVDFSAQKHVQLARAVADWFRALCEQLLSYMRRLDRIHGLRVQLADDGRRGSRRREQCLP